ncbi:hypothetical protein Nepgr_017735 [Nepenthes gracilis]|uniref:Uncharacterized protein n=1 Tax=Nepenthes gracilis TaxID=150966 RepID=A0AAD3SS71_NEPGR|nr:hypothetical protein Nepgr_017735 [Nepenthes gracilis]
MQSEAIYLNKITCASESKESNCSRLEHLLFSKLVQPGPNIPKMVKRAYALDSFEMVATVFLMYANVTVTPWFTLSTTSREQFENFAHFLVFTFKQYPALIRLYHWSPTPEKSKDEITNRIFEDLCAMDAPRSWDALRKQARKLEAQLDEQMNSYRKLVAAKVDTADKDIESGIELLLKQLQQVNFQMQAWVSSGGSEMVSHTLMRHQEILQDLTQEFYRLRSSLRANQEHASLLQDFREFDRSRLDLEGGGNSVELALLKEHASISRSTGQMDSVISQAQSTLGALVLQGSTFGGINSKLNNVSSHLPTVNHILAAIKRKKSMDTIILSLVASHCFSSAYNQKRCTSSLKDE